MNRSIAVVGLGYVGLPVALAFARRFPGTLGFDVDEKKVAMLSRGVDDTKEHSKDEILESKLKFTSRTDELKAANFYIVAVPTPIDEDKRPDLRALVSASVLVGGVLKAGDIVVYESTVYPGVTEDVCGATLERASGLKCGIDFKLGYSPERINPGDREHTLEKVVKIVAGQDAETLKIISGVYGAIVSAGVHEASSIKVAEAAKVIENTQRDLNIALMNELAIIFDRMSISTREVLEAAGTKWNFLRFSPGLVGGHCIGVDPYYLTTKAEQLGYRPQVILAGRRINDGMGLFIAQRMVKLLSQSGVKMKGARVGVLGLTFKENVRDIRNSRVPDIMNELKAFAADIIIYDPLADAEEVKHEYGLELATLKDLNKLDGLILAVPHREFLDMERKVLFAMLNTGGIFIDVKSAIPKRDIPEKILSWQL